MSDLSGWSIVSDDDNGSLLVQSPQGHRRRIWRYDVISAIQQERDQYKAALESQYNVKTDLPIFKGLVGGTFPTGALLATCHRLQGELDAAREAARLLFKDGHIPLTEFDSDQLKQRHPWLEDYGDSI